MKAAKLGKMESSPRFVSYRRVDIVQLKARLQAASPSSLERSATFSVDPTPTEIDVSWRLASAFSRQRHSDTWK